MLSAYRRPGIVVALALAAGITGATVRPPARSMGLPAIDSLIAGTQWYVVRMYKPDWGIPWKQWVLSDRHGHNATLYLEASTAIKRAVHWTGELGYLGEGYVVTQRTAAMIPLPNGQRAPVTIAQVRRGADRELIAYAIVGPDGIQAHGTDDFIRSAWYTLSGGKQAYYLVRVSVYDESRGPGARITAVNVLSPVLAELRKDLDLAMHQGA